MKSVQSTFRIHWSLRIIDVLYSIELLFIVLMLAMCTIYCVMSTEPILMVIVTVPDLPTRLDGQKDKLVSIRLSPSNVLVLLVNINVVYLHAIRFALRVLPSFASRIKNDNKPYLKETFEM